MTRFRRQFVELYEGKNYDVRTLQVTALGFMVLGALQFRVTREPIQFAGNSSPSRSSRTPDLWQIERPDLAMLFLKSDIATGMDL